MYALHLVVFGTRNLSFMIFNKPSSFPHKISKKQLAPSLSWPGNANRILIESKIKLQKSMLKFADTNTACMLPALFEMHVWGISLDYGFQVILKKRFCWFWCFNCCLLDAPFPILWQAFFSWPSDQYKKFQIIPKNLLTFSKMKHPTTHES